MSVTDDELNLTELIHRAQKGDSEAADSLFAPTYADLRKLARGRLRATGRNTLLDTSSLVHESYLRFAGAGRLRIEDRLAMRGWRSSRPDWPDARELTAHGSSSGVRVHLSSRRCQQMRAGCTRNCLKAVIDTPGGFANMCSTSVGDCNADTVNHHGPRSGALCGHGAGA